MRYFLSILIFITSLSYAQQIPLGSWRTHFSYNSATIVEPTGDGAYVAASSGLFYYDLSDNSVTVIGKIEGLQAVNITALAYDDQRDELLIGYESGNLDIIKSGSIKNIDLTTNSQVVGNKSVNHILIADDKAFISTKYGVLNFDLDDEELGEEYRQLGVNAQQIEVFGSAVLGDSLYLATTTGVIASNINNGTNLLDPDNWRRYTSIPQVRIDHIVTFNEQLVASISNDGLYSFNSQSWEKLSILDGFDISALSAKENLIIIADNRIYSIDEAYVAEEINITESVTPLDAEVDDDILYVSDAQVGLIIKSAGSAEIINPNGPASSQIFNLVENGSITLLPGGFNASFEPLNRTASISFFKDGLWYDFDALSDYWSNFTDVARFGRHDYFSSFTDGLIQANSNEVIKYDPTNSPLTGVGDSAAITTIASSNEGVWMINYEASLPLKLFDGGEWSSYSLITDNILELVNTRRYLFMSVNNANGGGMIVFEKESGQSRYLTTSDGNGGLPSTDVRSIAVDVDGLIWVGTASGVGYFNPNNDFINGGVDLIVPIFENRFLLRNQVINHVEIDAGNRKWFGTDNGAWLFDADITEQIYLFTSDNTPLPADKILDMAIQHKTGEVFFHTDGGLVSFRADATKAMAGHGEVKIFPNPVTPGFDGTIAISGLVYDANVKITDASGRLVWATKSAGGTATWNAQDINGNKAATGIYFVFSSDSLGEDTFIGKIAVVN